LIRVPQDEMPDDLEAAVPSAEIDLAEESVSASSSMDEEFVVERESAKMRHWKESPYAVGLVEPTWHDERQRRNMRPTAIGCISCPEEIEPTCGCLYLSGIVCTKLGAGRVGNMAVLKETSVGDRTKIQLVVGPYWPMLLCVTYPLIFGVSAWTAVEAIPHQNIIVVFIWATLTFGLIYSLFNVGFRDPGILQRHSEAPADGWRWNDQAQTFRPRGAIYDSDCAVIIEEFDHTCPWTGTGIGKKNMLAFQAFVALVFICLIFDIMLLTNTL